MPRAKTPLTKSAEVPTGDGTTVWMDFPKRCWAHVPSDDPKTWYLRMCWEPDDEKPDGDCLAHAIDSITRAELPRAQSFLQKRELPLAKGRLVQAWQALYPNREVPGVLSSGAVTPDETSTESEG